MILFQVKQNKNEKLAGAYGKFYAYPVVSQTYNIDQLAEHMSAHNTPFSPGAIKGMLTDMVICVRELTLQGIAVKIDNLAIFSIGIKNKEGAKKEEEFSVAKNIAGVRLRSRATGELMSANLNLDATLKKATAIVASSSSGSSNTGGTDTPSTPGGEDTDNKDGSEDSGGTGSSGNVSMD